MRERGGSIRILVMLLKAIRGAGVHSVALAGFGGHRASDMNYYKTDMESMALQRTRRII